jgi:hypothetical protein
MHDREEMQALLDTMRDDSSVPESVFRLLELVVKHLPFSPDEVPTRPLRRTPLPFKGPK